MSTEHDAAAALISTARASAAAYARTGDRTHIANLEATVAELRNRGADLDALAWSYVQPSPFRYC